MTTTLRKAQVAEIIAATFPEYRGRKFRACESTTVAVENVWGGGTKDDTRAVKQFGNKLAVAEMKAAAFGDARRAFPSFEVPDDVLVVVHSIFCGRDVGITIHYSPNSIFKPRLIEAK